MILCAAVTLAGPPARGTAAQRIIANRAAVRMQKNSHTELVTHTGVLMQIKAILFDLDGTLANTLPLCIKAYKHAFEHYLGHTVTDEEVTTHFGLTEEG